MPPAKANSFAGFHSHDADAYRTATRQEDQEQMRYVTAVIVGLLALSAVACQQSAPPASQKPAEQASGGQVNVSQSASAASKAVEQASGGQISVSQSGQSVTIKNPAGESVTIGGNVPDELKNFPVPSGFTFNAADAGSMSGKDGVTAVGTWSGKSSVESVSDFYVRTLVQQGWTQSMAMSSGGNGVLMYDKGDNSAWITVEQDGQTTTISVLYGKKTP